MGDIKGLVFFVILSLFTTDTYASVSGFKPRQCGSNTSAPFKAGQSLNSNPCQGRGTSLVSVLKSKALFLCKDGKPTKSYRVALGSGGIGKTREGDNKTPVGTYSLAAPRLSGGGFGIFIYIGYPTGEQILKGYTGNSVGVHGPPRANVCDGESNVEVDWTWGCVAVSDDKSIAEVAAFVVENKVSKIHLLGTAQSGAVRSEMSMSTSNQF